MILCGIDPDIIASDAFDLVAEYDMDDNGTPESFIASLNEYILTLKDQYDMSDASASGIIANAIIQGIEENEGLLIAEDYTTIENIKSIIEQSITDPNSINLKRDTDINNTLQDTESAESKSLASREFLDKSYGTAVELKQVAMKQADIRFFDAMFVNRGSIKGDKGIVSDLNTNLRQYQQQLLESICDYLRYSAKDSTKFSQEELNALNNPKLYNLVNGKYVNTGILRTLDFQIRRLLSPNKLGPNKLRDFYEKSLNGDEESKLTLDAFNSYIFLKHFDSYLKIKLGDFIEIKPKEFNRITDTPISADKYRLADSTAQVFKTWRTNENFDPGKEIDQITQMAVNTTPVYRDGSSKPMDGRYLTFQNFQNIVGKVKELAYSAEAQTTIFDKNFRTKYASLWNSLTPRTKNYISDRSLSSVINSIRQNPRQNLNIIFELIANKYFRESVPQLFSKDNFVSEEIDHIYSIYKGIFSDNDSVRSLVGLNPAIDYYGFIAQASDTIFKNTFIQYYVDNNGILKTRQLTDLALYNIQQKLISDINANNANKVNYNTQLAKDYDISQKNGIVTFTIPETDIKISVNLANENTKFPNTQALQLFDNPKVKEFVDNVLALGLQNNVEFFNIFKTLDTTPNMAARHLLELASRVVANQYVANTQLKDITYNESQSKIAEIYPNGNITYNKSLGQINVVSNSESNGQILNNIAKTRSILQGLATSTQVKDSQSASQNLQSLSRLLGSWGSQVELIEKYNDPLNPYNSSVTRDLTLVNAPGLFEGHFTTSEYYNRKTKQNKSAVKFNVAELSFANIMADFVPALLPTNKRNGTISDGHAAFLASVNSDKTTIGKILFNLNTLINGKRILDLTTPELQQVIAQDFGTMYSRVCENVESDFTRLSTFIRSQKGWEWFPDLGSQYVSNFNSFNTYWYNLTNARPEWAKFGKTSIDVIKYWVSQYNRLNRLNPLELVDNIHFKKGNFTITDPITKKFVSIKGLSNSNTLLSEIARFNPTFLQGRGVDTRQYPSLQEFFVDKESEVLSSLLRSKFEVNLLKNSDEANYIHNTYGDAWETDSKKMILAKATLSDGSVVNLTSAKDLRNLGIKTGYSDYDNLNVRKNQKDPTHKTKVEKIQLHPILEQYNYLDYWLTQSWMNTTVGSFISHPAKGSDPIQQQASQYQAQHKRNVSMTAQMHEFMLNSLNGITEDYVIAVIDDIKDYQTVLGITGAEITPYDGATFVNPFNVYLENNSLGGARAGIDKKQFIHFKNPRFGNGGIIKTAGFGITNDRIRNSPLSGGWHTMMRKMTNHTWLNEDGSKFISNDFTNILKGFDGKNIIYNNCFFNQNGKFYKITDVRHLGNNEYSRTIQEVNTQGQNEGEAITNNFIIDSNYALWNFLGGQKSMSLNGNGRLQWSESSITKVVEVMNKMGQTKSDQVETQEQVWQPMKHSDVNYLVTKGAIKHGAANINPNSRFTDNNPLDIQRIKMYQAGIQLDKEHHADNAELSLPTQIISACASLGYTRDIADGLYKALAFAADVNTKDLSQAVSNYNDYKTVGNKKALQEEVLKLVVKALSTDNSDSFAKTLAKEVMANEETDFKNLSLPLSDNTVFSKMISTISSTMTKKGIRLKIPGLLAVLTPSYNLFKLFRDRKFDSFQNPNVELEQMQQEKDLNPLYVEGLINNFADIRLGRKYKITYNDVIEVPSTIEDITNLHKRRGDETDSEYLERVNFEYQKETDRLLNEGNRRMQYVEINTTNDLRQLKQDIKSGKVNKVVEYVKDGRNLGAYNVTANGVSRDGNQIRFQLWELDVINRLQQLQDIKNGESELSLQDLLGFEPTYSIDAYIKSTRHQVQKALENLSDSVEDKLEQFNKLAPEEIDNWLAMNLEDAQLEQINLLEGGERLAKAREFIEYNQEVVIDGVRYKVDKQSLSTEAYELIMPKTYIDEFGFNEFTDLNEVKNNPNWFIEQYFRNKNQNRVQDNQYDIELNRANGDHIFIMRKSKLLNSRLNPVIDELITEEQNDKLVRLDSKDNVMYEMLPGVEVYTDANGVEVLIVDDTNILDVIDNYVTNIPFDTINLSQELANDTQYLSDVVDILADNKVTEQFFKKSITKDADIICPASERVEMEAKYPESTIVTLEEIMNSFNELRKINSSNFEQYLDENNPIVEAGRAKHSSFLKSLDIVAARIPSQSLQSFMPMKVVAYDNPNRNSAYVSNLQILLQGSDFDIDAVSLVTFDINSSGTLPLWSPYAKLSTIEMLEESMKLPFPTGQEIQYTETENIQDVINFLNNYKYLFTISRNRKGDLKVKFNWNMFETRLGIQMMNNLLNENQILIPTKDKLQNFVYNAAKQNVFPFLLKNASEVDMIFDELKKAIDKHNTYLNNAAKYKLDKVTNNYAVNSLYNVINDPVNLVQAQTPIDIATGPLKKISNDPNLEASKLLLNRTPGNWVNKIESIFENQEGKDCIAIVAVGIKGYFALTQYYNTVLNEGNPNRQNMLIGKQGDFTNMLSNVRAKNVSTVTNQDVLNMLVSVKNEEDAVLALSALMSLATDNAKELSLAKLNAGSAMISTYIYGISIGMDFKDISRLLMDPTGLALRGVIDSNLLQETPGYNQLVRAFDYFESGPSKHLKEFDRFLDYQEGISRFKPLAHFNAVLENMGVEPKFGVQNLTLYLQNRRDTNRNLSEVLSELDSFKGKYQGSEQDIANFNKLIDFAQNYAIEYYSINWKHFNEIKRLNKGAEEMKKFGAIVGLNQGIPTDITSILRKCALIEDALVEALPKKVTPEAFCQQYNITGDLANSGLQIDLTKFAFKPSYRQKCIEAYNILKTSFNILDAATSLPHVMKYIQLLSIVDQSAKQSYRYRSIKDTYRKIRDDFNLSVDDAIKGLNNYLGDSIISDWMLQDYGTFVLPEGNKIFSKEGVLQKEPLKEATEIQLGTDQGNATFRMWMENEVIPNLKRQYKSNKFISDLSNNIRTNTTSRNGAIVYTLPINMLPKLDSERVLLNNYIDHFNRLDLYNYTYKGINKENISVPITELFTLYALIAHNGKLGEGSLMSILENYQNRSVLKSLHDYTSNLDKSDLSIVNEAKFNSNIIPYVASKNGPWTTYGTWTWGLNETTGRIELMKKLQLNRDEPAPSNSVNGFGFQGALDPNYFYNTRISDRSKVFNVDMRVDNHNETVEIIWGQGIEKDEVKLKGEIVLKGEKLPTKTVNGITMPNIDMIKKMINKELNPC